jgi:PBP1b-binding outer membrane lipoprotein LpoB
MENETMRMLSVLALITLAFFLTGCNGDSDDAPATVDPPAATNGEEAPATPAVDTEEDSTETE